MYTVMFGTENQFIVNYTSHQKASETDQFVGHMMEARRRMGCFPRAAIGDAAYGSEENYAFLDRHGIANYLKYSTFDQSRHPQYFDKERFTYHTHTDSYHCPEGRTLSFQQYHTYHRASGFCSEARVYRSNDCSNCSLSAQCKRTMGNRTLQVNARLEHYRDQARGNLESEQGIALRRQRSTDIEPTIGDIK
jgi:hypothetical protein